MVTITLERSKKNEWEIKNEHGDVICRRNLLSQEDAIEWVENYMTSFQIRYVLKTVNKGDTWKQ